MSNALDLFRAQLAVADQVHAQLRDVAALLQHLQTQVAQLAHDRDLRALLQEERHWLEATQRAVDEVRRWRQHEAPRYGASVLRRWVVALAFALASAFAVGAGFSWIAGPMVTELEALRPQAELGALVEQRMRTMTSAERRRFDALMQLKVEPQ